MNEKAFAKRLEREIPGWQAKGWVSADGGTAMLAELATRQPKAAWASSLALAGALLLGVGVISWFAAHWNEMSKLLKLLLVFAALGASHLAHGACLHRNALPKLAQGMALLSVLFFGAAIMLIGQIYHIDAHFPDGIALWAVGGLLTAVLLASQPAMVASLLLAGLWTWQEQFDFRSFNWPLMIYLGLAALPLLRHDWRFAARGWGLLFVLWLIGWHAHHDFGDYWGSPHAHLQLFALQVLGLAGLWALAQGSRQPLARGVRGEFLLAGLIGAFIFTFPDLGTRRQPARLDLLPWLAALLAALAIYATGIVRLVRRSELAAPRLRVGIALALGFAALLASEVVMPRSGSLPALFWNALFLGVVYWIGDLAIRHGDRPMLNRAFTGFAVWVLARYFDTFWSLLDRSLFFMAGGVLLLAGGGWLERRRRSLVSRIDNGGQA